MKLVKRLQAVLVQLDASECSWSVAMDDRRYADVVKLEKLGLVKLHPRYTSPRERGKCRGRFNGYDVTLTPLGKETAQS